MDKSLPVIGRNALIEIIGHVESVPAKVDTGADSSSIWASNIHVDREGTLSFTLFGKGSQYYTGEVITRKSYRVARIRSSNGHVQIRYRIELPVKIKGKRIRASFYLSDRSVHHYPILLGRRTLNKKFLVDVSQQEYARPVRKSFVLNKEMLENPYKFHKKYHHKQK